MKSKKPKLVDFFRKRGGLASYAEVIDAGFKKAALKAALNSGSISRIDRGLYKTVVGSSVAVPDIVVASIKAPKGVMCLISALAFHEATDEIPRHVEMAIRRGAHVNKINYPPMKFYRFAPEAWKAGVEERNIESHKVKVYNLAKTIADCFKFRNKIGIGVAREALKTAITEKRILPTEIMRYAKICRVANVIKPVLEAML